MGQGHFQPKDDPTVVSRLAWMVVSLVLFAIAFVLVWGNLWAPYLEEKAFAKTRGQIVSIRTESWARVGSNNLAHFGIKHCEYAYEVDGVTYTGRNLHPGPPMASEEERKDVVSSPLLRPEAVDAYRPNGTVTVFYKKTDPAVSALFAGFYHFDTPTDTNRIGWILLCGFFLILAWLAVGTGVLMLYHGGIRGQHSVYVIRRIVRFWGGSVTEPLNAPAR